ncbi:transposase [Escherichia coli]
MAKPKYSLETRLAAVNHYLAGHDGARRIAERFGVEETSLRKRDKFSPRPCHIYAPSIGGNFPAII